MYIPLAVRQVRGGPVRQGRGLIKTSKITRIYTIKKRERFSGKNGEIEIRDLRDKFFMMDDAYVNGHARILGIYATGVYMVLCRHASVVNQQSFPKISTIANELGVSEKMVRESVKKLAKYRLIHVEKRKGRSHLYTLTARTSWLKTPHVAHKRHEIDTGDLMMKSGMEMPIVNDGSVLMED